MSLKGRQFIFSSLEATSEDSDVDIAVRGQGE